MKLISWNCQGLGNPLIVRALRAMVAQEKPDALFLMETKKSGNVSSTDPKKVEVFKEYDS